MQNVTSYAKGAASVAAVGIGLLYYGQNYLIYPSNAMDGRTNIPIPRQFGIMQYEHLTLEPVDGIKIKAYLIPQDVDVITASRPTVLMFHGNGGNYGQRLPIAKLFAVKMRCNVALLCYRGYGDSEGEPSEKGFQLDSQALLDYILSHEKLSRTKIILYGQSIGGAVAIDLASRNPSKIHALILENTFTALPKVIPAVLPWLSPFAWLCHQKWPSDKRLPLIPSSTPILMLSGRRDQIVPPQHMNDLWEISLKSGRINGAWVEFEDRDHNNTCASAEYWDAVTDFVQKHI